LTLKRIYFILFPRSPKHFVFCLSGIAALSIHAGNRRFYQWDGSVEK
jgi:hypothetical protein